jgi:diguanylate cyclase (GGDEF)-like protein
VSVHDRSPFDFRHDLLMPMPPMRIPSLSIRATVLLAIIAGMVLPALVVLAIDRHVSREAQTPIVERNRAAALVLAAAVVTEPAWTLSEPGLEAAMQRILREPSVCGVDILDVQPAGTPKSFSARKCEADHPVTVSETAVLHEGQAVARLRLAFDDTEVESLLDEQLRQTAWLVAAQVVIGVLVLAGVLSLRLLRPIDRLKQQAGTLSAREPTPALVWTRRDELGQLGQHLNDVRQRIQELIRELESKNRQLHKLAMFDHLTGLPNRALLRELFAHEAAAARRANRSLALMFIDLDHFKTVNDTLGHAAGDELLLTIARRLLRALRESDVVCRLGGDEFVVLLPNSEGWDYVAATAQRLLDTIRDPVTLPGTASAALVSASVGIAMYPADGADFEALARTADMAMYRSKDLGRARFSFYHPDLDTALRSRVELERELALAIEHHQLALHYQPVFDADGGRIVGCEALVRWNHPQRGLLMPGAFIRTAEETGLIRELGLWTLHTACAQFAAWRDAGLQLGLIAVNVSALQVHDPLLAEAVRTAMSQHGLRAGELELELTESTLLSDTNAVMRTVARLRNAGALLAIDDFGTGFSSLSYLKLLKPDKLKIDRSFVRDLPDDPDDRALVQAIIGMAQALSITVVGEGVETQAQCELLQMLGCRLQQGYLHGRPVPAPAFATLLHPEETQVLALER